MNDQTKQALDWIFNKYPSNSDAIRSYPLNLVIFIAQMCAEYREAEIDAAVTDRRGK